MVQPQTPIVNAGSKYLNGFDLAFSDEDSLAFTVGQCRDSTNTNDILVSSPLLIEALVVGAGGIDQGIIQDDEVYAVYVVADSTGYKQPAGLFSLSATNPVLPYGYDMFRRISWVLTTSGSRFHLFWVYGFDQDKEYYFNSPYIAVEGVGTGSFGDVSLKNALAPFQNAMPAVQTEVLLNIEFTATAASDSIAFSIPGSFSTQPIMEFSSGAGALQIVSAWIPMNVILGVPTVRLSATVGKSYVLTVAGFRDSLT